MPLQEQAQHKVEEQSQHNKPQIEEQQASEAESCQEDDSCSISDFTDIDSPGTVSTAAAAAAFEQQQQLLGEDELIEGIRACIYYGMGFSDDEEEGDLAGVFLGSEAQEVICGAQDNPTSDHHSRSEPAQQHEQQYQKQHATSMSSAESSGNSIPDSYTLLKPSSSQPLQHAKRSDDSEPLQPPLQQHQQRQQGLDGLDGKLLGGLHAVQQQQQQQPGSESQVPTAAIQATQALLAGLSLHGQTWQAAEQSQQQHQQPTQPGVKPARATNSSECCSNTSGSHSLPLPQHLSSGTGDDPSPQLLQQQQQPEQPGLQQCAFCASACDASHSTCDDDTFLQALAGMTSLNQAQQTETHFLPVAQPQQHQIIQAGLQQTSTCASGAAHSQVQQQASSDVEDASCLQLLRQAQQQQQLMDELEFELLELLPQLHLQQLRQDANQPQVPLPGATAERSLPVSTDAAAQRTDALLQ